MLYLGLAVICSVGIAVTFTYAQRARIAVFPLFAVNYTVATAGALIGSGASLHSVASPWPLLLGMVLGGLFVWCFWLFMQAVSRLGMTIPVALMRLSVVLPTVGSVLLFAESPDATQVAGMVLAFVALPLASREAPTRANLRVLISVGLGWGLLLFLSYGVTDFLFKVQQEILPAVRPYELLTVVFLTCLGITATVSLLRHERITGTTAGLGLLLGTLNLFSSYFFIRALGELPGIVAYPANGIGVILLSALVAVLLWKERLPRRNILSLLLASVALLLIS